VAVAAPNLGSHARRSPEIKIAGPEIFAGRNDMHNSLMHQAEDHRYGIGACILFALAVWGSVSLLPDVLRYIRITRM
jgi:hypothetical protein